MNDPLLTELRYKLVDTLKLDIDPESLVANAPLADLNAGEGEQVYQIDSVDLVEFMVAIENALDVELLEDERVAEVASLQDLTDLLKAKFSEVKLSDFCRSERARRANFGAA